MYRLYQSPHIGKLAEALNDEMKDQLPADPLVPVEVIVPNRDTARWFSLYLAEMNGIAANIRFLLPSEWLWERFRELRPCLPDQLPSDPGPMSWSIYNLLGNERVLAHFPELSSWLRRQQGLHELHRWQLSKQISSVFDQYQVYRPGMLFEWEQGSGDLQGSGSDSDRGSVSGESRSGDGGSGKDDSVSRESGRPGESGGSQRKGGKWKSGIRECRAENMGGGADNGDAEAERRNAKAENEAADRGGMDVERGSVYGEGEKKS